MAKAAKNGKPNFLILWGDDIGQSNLSIFTKGMMGYRTPNIDRIGEEGAVFTDYYGEQSCTAGRASFITGQTGLRTGLTKVGLPGADLGLQPELRWVGGTPMSRGTPSSLMASMTWRFPTCPSAIIRFTTRA